MSNFALPDTVAAQLAALSHPVQLCDASGKTLGCFVPAVDPAEFELLGQDLSAEELRQVDQSSEWYSTEDVLRHLEKLQ